ncbi:hypothetical protein FRB96_006372 [Tulasnella sp. 330]|nr:hypothetical protein FRB96_006372 [Tulasnella sp. 330]KAG8878817.1 hypothetical protein FRB97_002185 [Tulasnella sp. 331]
MASWRTRSIYPHHTASSQVSQLSNTAPKPPKIFTSRIARAALRYLFTITFDDPDMMTDTLLSATFQFSSEQVNTTTWKDMMYEQPPQDQQRPYDGSASSSSCSSSMDMSFGLPPDSFMSVMMHSVVGGCGGDYVGVGPLITTADGVSLETSTASGSSTLLHEGGAMLGTDGVQGGTAEGGEEAALEQGSSPATPSVFSSYEARSCVLEQPALAPALFPTPAPSTSTFAFDFTVPSPVSISHSNPPQQLGSSLSLPSTFQFTSINPSTPTTITPSPSSSTTMSTSSVLFPSFELSTKRAAEERDNENDFQGSAKKPRVVVASEETTVDPRDLCNNSPPLAPRSPSPPNRPPSPPRSHTSRPAVSSPLSSAPTTPPPAPNRPRRRSSRSNQIALLKFALDPWLRLSRNLGPQSGGSPNSNDRAGADSTSCRPGIFNPATWPSAGNLRELRNSDPFSSSFGNGLDMDLGMNGMMGGMGVVDLHTHQWNLVDA